MAMRETPRPFVYFSGATPRAAARSEASRKAAGTLKLMASIPMGLVMVSLVSRWQL